MSHPRQQQQRQPRDQSLWWVASVWLILLITSGTSAWQMLHGH